MSRRIDADAVKDAGQHLTRIDRQTINGVAVIANDIPDVQIGCRLSKDRLLVSNRSRAVRIVVRLPV